MTYPIGSDCISHWDGPADWQKVKASGLKFVMIRAGSIDDTITPGVCYTDHMLEPHYNGARSVQMLISIFFYMRPKYSGGLQGQFLVDTLVSMNVPTCTPIMVDVEEPGVSPADASQQIYAFIQVVSLVYPKIFIYTRQNIWDPNVAPLNWEEYDLDAARYNTELTSPWSDGKYIFRDWNTWTFWQFTKWANPVSYGFPGPNAGGSTEFNLAYFNGTEEGLLEYFGDQYPATEPPPDPLAELTARLDSLDASLDRLTLAHLELFNRVDALEMALSSLAKVLNAHLHPPAPTPGGTSPDDPSSGSGQVQSAGVP